MRIQPRERAIWLTLDLLGLVVFVAYFGRVAAAGRDRGPHCWGERDVSAHAARSLSGPSVATADRLR